GEGVMRIKSARARSDGSHKSARSSHRRSGVMARRSAILLGGTTAIALSIAQPARAIVINDQVAAAVGGISNHYDQSEQFPNVGSLRFPNRDGSSTISGCTGSLINSRTVLTAAHCLYNERTGLPITDLRGVSFMPDPNRSADPGLAVSTFKGF